jgi:hypothetical protein
MELMETRDVVRRAVARARSDDGFRTELTSDPREAIERGFGVRLPAEVDAARLRERIGTRFPVEAAGDELDDAQLEGVAGGGCVPCFG